MTTPEKLGRYEIISELGKGAMGIVYLGRDPLIGRQLALKTFRLGYSAGDQELEQFRVRFLREAQSAGILSHPNIVTIHDVAVDPGGDFFIAMEYVQGTDLKLVMQRQGRFEPSFAVEVVAQIADGLGYAHSKGVVHRDIKPANIIITADKQAKITDFGIARVEASNLTVEGQLLGTPNYMAPEQIQGKPVDHRADIFSLGVMFYELVTGAKPFAAPNLTAVTHRIVFEPYPPLEQIVPGLPAGIAQVLDRALAKDPAERYDSGANLADDLRAIYAEPSTGTQATSRSGSFLDLAPSVQAPPGAVPPPDATSTGIPPATGGGTVVTGTAGGTLVTGTAGTTLVTGTTGGGTLVTGAAPTAAAQAPGAHVAAPAPAVSPAAAPTAGPPTTSGGMPIAGRIAAALGVAIALAVVGIGIFKLIASDAEVPRARDPELEHRQQVQPLVEEGQKSRDAGQPTPALPIPPQTQPVGPAASPLASAPLAAPPAVAPATPATLVIQLHSEVSEGRLTIFTGQKKIYQQPFKFVIAKGGVFSRERATSGRLSDRLTLPSGDLDLRIYVRPTDAQTRSTEVIGNLPPGGTRVLKIEVSDQGRISATLE